MSTTVTGAIISAMMCDTAPTVMMPSPSSHFGVVTSRHSCFRFMDLFSASGSVTSPATRC